MSDGIDSYHKVELHTQLHTNIHKNKNNIVAYDFLLPDLFLLFLHLLFTILPVVNLNLIKVFIHGYVY